MYLATATGKLADAILRARGYDPTQYTFSTKELSQMEDIVNQEYRTVMEAEFWPQLMLTERRQYRPTYDAGVPYTVGQEVIDDPTLESPTYYRSLTNANIDHALTDTTNWQASPEDFVPYIAFNQPWETNVIDYSGIQLDDCVYHKDPLIWPRAAPVKGVKFWKNSLLIPTLNMPKLPYIRFRPAFCEVSYTAWSNATNYAAGDGCYAPTLGMSYIALIPNSNVDPTVSGDIWCPVTIQTMFFKYLQWQCAGMLTSEQEGRVRGEKLSLAATEMERLRHMFLQKSGEHPRAKWRGRRQLTPIGVQQYGVLGTERGYF